MTDSVAYLDTSWLIAIALKEPEHVALSRRLEDFTHIYSANLLEAELLAALKRERVAPDSIALDRLSWVLPVRALRREIEKVLSQHFVRGADCWHLASALYVADTPGSLTFLTLDKKQLAIAKALGFRS